MKTRALFGSSVIRHWSFVLSSVVATATIAATDDALRPVAFQNGVNQQALGAETADLAREINALIDELQRNGFPLQSLSTLTELAAQLNALGGTEMTAIAQRLRKLGENSQADPRATATEAYLAQQAIESRLKTLARQISIQQLREETARRLEALITRQLGIQRETKAIASAKPEAGRQRLLESDQSGIGDDLQTFFQTGNNLLARLREQESSAGAPAAPAQTFAERINGAQLTALSTEALGELKGKRYPTAYARQDTLVAELRKILQGILSSLPKEQRLASALQQVSALRQQEEAARKAAENQPKPDPAQTAAKAESAEAAAEQAQTLANQVDPLSPEAADALRKAQEALQNQADAAEAAAHPGKADKPKSKTQKPPAADPAQSPAAPAAAAANALAAAEAALQKALTQAQTPATQDGQAPTPQSGQQQAANSPQNPKGQKPGQPQQPQSNQQANQQSGQQSGQPQPPRSAQNPQNAPLRADGQPPGDRVNQNVGDAQNQIAGRGPDATDPAQVAGGLRPDERDAFTALQGERYPAEYSAWIRQYWRNLAQEQ